jgi:hypothetical protein
MPGYRLSGCAAAALALLLLMPASGAAVVAPALQAAGWRELPNPNKAENVFEAGPDEAIEVISQGSVSTLYRPVAVNLTKRPLLTWRWRVDQAAPATDLSAKGEDDCSLAVFVGFPYEPEQASFFERIKRPLVESWVGEEAPGRVLRYVFCGAHRQGETVESPHLGAAGAIKVLRPAASPTGEWLVERVDLVADYRAAFGAEPPDPSQIAIQADTDDTQSASRALVAGLSFVARGSAAAAGSTAPR